MNAIRDSYIDLDRQMNLLQTGGPEAYRMNFDRLMRLEFELTPEAAERVILEAETMVANGNLRFVSSLPFTLKPEPENDCGGIPLYWGFNKAATWEQTREGSVAVRFQYPDSDLTDWKAWQPAYHAILATVYLVTEALAFFTPKKPDSRQQMFLLTGVGTGEGPNHIAAIATPAAKAWLLHQKEGYDQEVSGAMQTSYKRLTKGLLARQEFADDVFLYYQGSRGAPYFTTGHRCDLGIVGYHFGLFPGFELTSNNVDNPGHALVLLAGLAALWGKMRSEEEETVERAITIATTGK